LPFAYSLYSNIRAKRHRLDNTEIDSALSRFLHFFFTPVLPRVEGAAHNHRKVDVFELLRALFVSFPRLPSELPFCH
jgi:hypothetical protein